jgi:hypothetical protein
MKIFPASIYFLFRYWITGIELLLLNDRSLYAHYNLVGAVQFYYDKTLLHLIVPLQFDNLQQIGIESTAMLVSRDLEDVWIRGSEIGQNYLATNRALQLSFHSHVQRMELCHSYFIKTSVMCR